MNGEAVYVPALPGSAGTPAIEAGTGWLVSLMTGSLAVGLCVLAIAAVGLIMLGGRMPVRTGLRVVLGCFVLLGAPVIAGAFLGAGQGIGGRQSAPAVASEGTGNERNLPPSDYDPYAGASLRQD